MNKKTHEVECVDCGADIIDYVSEKEPRCDTCKDHHYKLCAFDCPIRCPVCKAHHFILCEDT